MVKRPSLHALVKKATATKHDIKILKAEKEYSFNLKMITKKLCGQDIFEKRKPALPSPDQRFDSVMTVMQDVAHSGLDFKYAVAVNMMSSLAFSAAYVDGWDGGQQEQFFNLALAVATWKKDGRFEEQEAVNLLRYAGECLIPNCRALNDTHQVTLTYAMIDLAPQLKSKHAKDQLYTHQVESLMHHASCSKTPAQELHHLFYRFASQPVLQDSDDYFADINTGLDEVLRHMSNGKKRDTLLKDFRQQAGKDKAPITQVFTKLYQDAYSVPHLK